MRPFYLLLIGLFCVQSGLLAQKKHTFKGFDSEVVNNSSFSKNVNAFCLEMLKTTGSTANVVLAPASLYSIISIVYSASGGSTEKELCAKLPLYTDKNIQDSLCLAFIRQCKLIDNAPVNVSNFWVDENVNINREYAEKLSRYYEISPSFIRLGDSLSRANSITLMNDWASNQSGGRIDKIVNSQSVNENTKIILCNIFQYKGLWEIPFDEMFSAISTFNLSSGKTVEAVFMNQNNSYKYFENELLQAVDFDMNADISMTFVLPHEDESIESLLNVFNPDYINDLWNSMIPAKVQVSIPRFKIAADNNLNNNLVALGVKEIFSNSANFLNMTKLNNLKVDRFTQQCFFEIDEMGAEATSATTVTMRTKSAYIGNQIIAFNADHPFFAFLRNKKDNTILFAAIIRNPGSGE
jgi:serpin B